MKNKAFTLIETLVAVSIITIAIVGPMTAANRAIVAAETSRDQLTASYLAQEGVEYVRAARDDAYLANRTSPDPSAAWDAFVGASGSLSGCIDPGICALGPLTSSAPIVTSALVPCDHEVCPSAPIVLGDTGMEYTRTVQIKDVSVSSSAPDVRVTSLVSWYFHGTRYNVTVTNHLTPWQ